MPIANCCPLKISEAAALAVCLEIGPPSFCEGHTGIRKFAQTIFEMGQPVPAKEKINPKSHMSERAVIRNAIKNLSDKTGKILLQNWTGSLQYGGSIMIDGVHLKVQEILLRFYSPFYGNQY